VRVALAVLLLGLCPGPLAHASAPRGAGYHEALAYRAHIRAEAHARAVQQRAERREARQVAYFSRLFGPNVGRWAPLVAEFFPAGELRNALYCIRYESGGNPNAYNPSGATGLFQLVGYPFNVFPPKVNVHMAYHLWRARGWSPWSVM
jgi:soluble lytic murein transglycosylase-like protein